MARSDKPKIHAVEDGAFLTFYGSDYSGAVPVVNPKNVTLEQLAQLCDSDAENVNAHDYVGAHRLLAALLYRSLGRKNATKIMFDISMRRGLHGMGGLCGLRDSYADLRVGESGHDWSGSFGE